MSNWLARLLSTRSLVVVSLILIGAFVSIEALSYDLGTLRRMGPGYFPMLLGICLCGVALLILFEPDQNEASDEDEAPERWFRPATLVLGGVLLFALLIRSAGFVPATFLCVLVAGLAERNNRPIELILLAAVATVFAGAVFVYGLGIPVRLIAI